MFPKPGLGGRHRQPTLRINASDVAIITGDNRFEPKADYRDRLWKQHSPDTFTGQTRHEQVQALFAQSPRVQAILRVATSTLSSSSDVTSVIDNARRELCNERLHLNLSNKDFLSLQDHLVSTLRTTYGTRSEEPTAAAFVATSAATATAELQAVATAAAAEVTAAASTAVSEAAVACTTADVASATATVTSAETVARVAEQQLESVIATAGPAETLSTTDATVVAATARAATLRARASTAKTELEVATAAALVAQESARATAAATTAALASAACNVDATRTIAKRARVAALVEDHDTYELVVGEFNGFRCVIRGKIDRIEETCEGRRLIEIKKRTQRLFHKVRSYENIQIQVYLQMLNLRRAQLWEMFGEELEKHDVARDDELYSTYILPQVRAFCMELCVSMSSRDERKFLE